MLDQLNYNLVDGKKSEKELTLFALTTCGFCKRAMAYLDGKGFKYRYFFADELALDDKTKLKEDFKAQYGQTLHFPTLVIDNKDILVGFVKPSWEMELEG